MVHFHELPYVHIWFFHQGLGYMPCNSPSLPPLHRNRHKCCLLVLCNVDHCSELQGGRLKQENIDNVRILPIQLRYSLLNMHTYMNTFSFYSKGNVCKIMKIRSNIANYFCSMVHLHRNHHCSWCKSLVRNMILHCSAPLIRLASEFCRQSNTGYMLPQDLSFHHKWLRK